MAAMNEKSILGLVSMMSSGVMNTHAPILRATEMAYRALDLASGDSGAAFNVTRDQSTVRGATAAQSLKSHTPSARFLSWQLRNLGKGAAPCVGVMTRLLARPHTHGISRDQPYEDFSKQQLA
jgi:hypothetical protein